MSLIPQLTVLFLGAVFSALPIICVKEYINRGQINPFFLYLAIISNIIVVLFYVKMFTMQNATVGYSNIKYLSIMLVFFVCIFYYKESITMAQFIGIVLGLITIYLLN